jgi:hypothetical protein
MPMLCLWMLLQGGGGHRVLQALGLPADCVKNFVLENDP